MRESGELKSLFKIHWTCFDSKSKTDGATVLERQTEKEIKAFHLEVIELEDLHYHPSPIGATISVPQSAAKLRVTS